VLNYINGKDFVTFPPFLKTPPLSTIGVSVRLCFLLLPPSFFLRKESEFPLIPSRSFLFLHPWKRLIMLKPFSPPPPRRSRPSLLLRYLSLLGGRTKVFPFFRKSRTRIRCLSPFLFSSHGYQFLLSMKSFLSFFHLPLPRRSPRIDSLPSLNKEEDLTSFLLFFHTRVPTVIA